jgi:hypothetical protein
MGVTWVELRWAAEARQTELRSKAERAGAALPPARTGQAPQPADRRRGQLEALVPFLSRLAAAGRV